MYSAVGCCWPAALHLPLCSCGLSGMQSRGPPAPVSLWSCFLPPCALQPAGHPGCCLLSSSPGALQLCSPLALQSCRPAYSPAALGLSGPIWAGLVLDLSGPIRPYLSLSEPGVSRLVWAYLGLSGLIWDYPGLSETIWAYLGAPTSRNWLTSRQASQKCVECLGNAGWYAFSACSAGL